MTLTALIQQWAGAEANDMSVEDGCFWGAIVFSASWLGEALFQTVQ